MSALAYMTVQQNYRESLNDPQVQIAEDAARALVSGVIPAELVPRDQSIDIAQSLATWIAVYDEKGVGVESNGVLDGAPPRVPQGVLDAAAANAGKDTNIPGQNRVSWQPRAGVRSAVVVQHFTGPKMNGFVAVGRNMREVEDHEAQLTSTIFYSWILTLLVTLIVQLGARYSRRR